MSDLDLSDYEIVNHDGLTGWLCRRCTTVHFDATDLTERGTPTQSGLTLAGIVESAAEHETVGHEVHPEAFCHRCLRAFLDWSAPSPLWNQIMRGGSINGDEQWEGIICPVCFMHLGEEQGVADLWRLTADRIHVELETVTPSGRVWDEVTQLWQPSDFEEHRLVAAGTSLDEVEVIEVAE